MAAVDPPFGATDSDREFPWALLPVSLGNAMEPEIPALANHLVTMIVSEIPEYQGLTSQTFWDGIQLGCEQSLRQFTSLLGRRVGLDGRARGMVRSLGQYESRSGRTLDSLQLAYRMGARMAWRTMAKVAHEQKLDAEQVMWLAEAVFAFVDELAAESVAGYAEAQTAAASEHERLRAVLVSALTSEEPDRPTVRRAAAAISWALPERLQVVVATLPEPGELHRALGPDVLATGGEQGEMIVVWPDPLGPGRAGRLDRALARLQGSVALGPPVRTAAAARSLAAARDTLALGIRGGIGAAPWSWADHLVELGLARAEEPLLELADRLLKPLDAEPAGSRARLLETLQALLDAGGNHSVAAHELDVHPQTVRYRLARLRELLSVDVDSPAARFELQLALRARALNLPDLAQDDEASASGAVAPAGREVSR
jgi:hypothetical protein